MDRDQWDDLDGDDGDERTDQAFFDEAAEWKRSGRPYAHWEASHAMRMWRGHARQLGRPFFAQNREEYERAVAIALPHLQGCGTS